VTAMQSAVAQRRVTRPLRVEMVLPSLEPGGQELVVVRLAKELAARGHNVGVTVTMEEGSLAPMLRDAGHDIALVPAPGLRTNWRAPSLITRFAERRPDVVHVHSGVWLKAARAARVAGTRRVIHTVHGLLDREPWYGDTLKRLAARATDVVVAVSEPLHRYLVDDVRLQPAQVVTVINGVDTSTFRPGTKFGALRRELGIGPDSFVVGHVARLAPIKNQILLIDAFAAFRRRTGDAHLIIVGDGPERESLEQRIRELSLEASAHLVGTFDDTAPLYREFDVFVLCSRAEGTSMSILESMASGVSVIATEVGGNPALLDGGSCGLLIPSENKDALVEALVRLASNETERAAFARAGRRRAESNYSESKVVDQYVDLYHGVGLAAARALESESCAG
jgi:glycosyltransferase involved in cell wall biosynthesis